MDLAGAERGAAGARELDDQPPLAVDAGGDPAPVGPRDRLPEQRFIRLEIDGRVNLFTSSFLKKAWRAMPAPYKVLISLRKVTELDSAGAEALTALVAGETGERRVAVSLEGLKGGCETLFPSGPPFFADDAIAAQSLGDVSSAPELIVRLQVK